MIRVRTFNAVDGDDEELFSCFEPLKYFFRFSALLIYSGSLLFMVYRADDEFDEGDDSMRCFKIKSAWDASLEKLIC